MVASGLSGKRVIVTGAGSGIGREAALQFAAEGAEVLLADLNPETAGDTATRIRDSGGTAEVVTGDLSRHSVVDSVVRSARDLGIRTNGVAPGGTATNIYAAVDVAAEAIGPGMVGKYTGVGVGRVAEAGELAAAIVFLASDAAGTINGAILPVDNGWSAV